MGGIFFMGLQRSIKHIEHHHFDADGWITLARKLPSGDLEQKHFRKEEISQKLSEWVGEDVFFSQNTFYKPSRRIEHIRQLRALFADVDCYLLNYTPEWVIGKIEVELIGQSIPDPNFIIHSGQGFVLIWLIEPVPVMALPLWQAVERYLAEQFKKLGGDTKATDAARIFRIDGTINSKNGAEVTVHYRHDYRYTLREIQSDYLPQLPSRKTGTKGRPSKTAHIFNTYTLHYSRLQDLVQLVKLRNYAVKGYRETICFLYRYWSCCYLEDEQEALRQTIELNAEFTEPLPEREVIRATKSAEKAWYARNNAEANRIAQERGYPGAGYNISNEKLIRWLDITEDEQKQLKTIIGRKEKQRRDTEATREQRRAAGVLPRDQYEARAAKRRVEAQKLRQEGMSFRKIGEALGCSEGEIRRLLKNA
jgi:hypothetical protein